MLRPGAPLASSVWAVVLAVFTTARGAPARAAESPSALAFVDGRAGQSLDGRWHVIVDPYDNGVARLPQPAARRTATSTTRKPKDRSDLVEYDFSRSPTLEVPGDWNTQRPELLYYEGTVWYQRTFDAHARGPAGRVFLQFGAAADARDGLAQRPVASASTTAASRRLRSR